MTDNKEREPLTVGFYNMGTVNKNQVTLSRGGWNCVTLFFSYRTLVGVDEVCCVNNWSNTTGKLLNELEPDKSKRVTQEKLNAIAEERIKAVVE